MKKQKIFKRLIIIFAIILSLGVAIWGINQTTSVADVGSFESYDSGSSSWSSSDWGSSSSDWGSSSRSSSSYDYDDDDDSDGLRIIISYCNVI